MLEIEGEYKDGGRVRVRVRGRVVHQAEGICWRRDLARRGDRDEILASHEPPEMQVCMYALQQ